MRLVGLFCTLVFLFGACETSPRISPTLAFYHWKGQLDLNQTERDYLDRLGGERLYLRFFDVDWDGSEAIPLSVLEKKSDLAPALDLVPTIFITNRTLTNISPEKVIPLADKILQKLTQQLTQFPEHAIPEIQLDCDWSSKSRENYFQLLKYLKQQLSPRNIGLSSTIRLHQVRHFKQTGVPPVDRGTLMYYNMGEVTSPEEKNSILNLDVAQAYLQNFDAYPLPLDLALPLFRWGVLWRDGKFTKLINGLRREDLQDTSRFEAMDATHFRLVKSTYLEGYYLYKEDEIRLEEVNRKTLEAAAKQIAPVLAQPPRTIIFYHLDSAMINAFDYENLQGIRSFFD